MSVAGLTLASAGDLSAAAASCIYEGTVRHRRLEPVPHEFTYGLFMMYLDLDELPELFRDRWLWSAERASVCWFRRRDHLGPPSVPLRISVADLVESEIGRRPAGPIRLLTHLRYFGYCMNPVSFYYCFDEIGRRVEAIVAEVSNTPWGERHCYVLDAGRGIADDPTPRFRFDKAFHVSPFMSMAQEYDWRFSTPDEGLSVHMTNREENRTIFDVAMTLDRRPITGSALAACLVRHPLMTWKVFAAIYWQALRLRLKRCPFHPHPKHAAGGGRPR